MNAGEMGLLTGGLAAIVVYFLHLWRCMIIEERFEKRYDDAEDYWRNQRSACNDKIEKLERKLRVSTDAWRLVDRAAAMRSETNGESE